MQRTLTEILVLVALSAVITVGTAVVGARLASPSTVELAPVAAMDMACLDEPFVLDQGTVVGALARLCIGDGVVRPRIELTGLTSGAVLTAWLAYTERPPAGRTQQCAIDDVQPDAPWALPMRIEGAVADQTGRVELASSMPGVRFVGGSEIQVLVVNHGWVRAERRAERVDRPLVWDRSWAMPPADGIGDNPHGGWILGCAVFRLRMGTESLEH
jgi:hypothetical protein